MSKAEANCPPPAADLSFSASTSYFEADNDTTNSFFFSSKEVEEDEHLNVSSVSVSGCPLPDDWDDVDVSTDTTKFSIDQAKHKQWELAKREIKHIRSQFCTATQINEESVEIENIFDFYVGLNSDFAQLWKNDLGFDDAAYLRFMHTVCLQSAHSQTISRTFNRKGPVSKDLLVTEEEYLKCWKTIAGVGKMDAATFVGDSRMTKYLWEKLEDLLNGIFRNTSVANRQGIISIALDDDKIWVHLTRLFDTFGIKYTTHVKDNCKGVIAHTAVSSGINIPLGFAFERKKDNALTCFKRILNSLFNRTGGGEFPDLQNVLIASDRGYMLPELVFKYLIFCGCMTIGTTKRLVQGWPFTFDQIMKNNDQRKAIQMKGAPTLYVKKSKRMARHFLPLPSVTAQER